MKVKILKEEGYDIAVCGLSLSYKDRAIPLEKWWCFHNCVTCGVEVEACEKFYRKAKYNQLASKLAHAQGGHNKFLRQIMLWLEIEAPRYWWSEFDTYKIGTVAQSESTIHTLLKRNINSSDFEEMEVNPQQIKLLNKFRKDKSRALEICKRYLPEGYLQRRIVSLNYAVLQNMVYQRKNHKLKEWKYFIKETLNQIEHPDLIIKEGK